MDKIKDFLEFLFRKEQEAIFLGEKKEEFNNYNQLAQEIKSYMNDITVGFGLPILTSPKPDLFYEDNPSYPNPRHVYKISEYTHERYGAFWACYVSIAKPNLEIKVISKCFLVASINEELKIVSNFTVSSDTKEWRYAGGDEDKNLRLHNLGKPVKVERYLKPSEDWSLQEYLKDR